MNEKARGLTRRGYLLAAVLALIGVVVGVASAATATRAVEGRVEGFQRVGVPGTSEVRFDQAGSYTLYYEAPGVGNEEETGVSLPPVHLALTEAESGTSVPVRRYEGSFDYSIAGHEGFAVATVRIERPGRYRLQADATITPGIADIAVGKSIARGLSGMLAAGFVSFASIVAAVVVGILTAVRRRDSRCTGSVPPSPPA